MRSVLISMVLVFGLVSAGVAQQSDEPKKVFKGKERVQDSRSRQRQNLRVSLKYPRHPLLSLRNRKPAPAAATRIRKKNAMT